jgi:hypothetical protein
MTDLNTAMMREVFKWLSKYEQPPVGEDEAWWCGMTRDAAAIYERYQTPLTRNILYGIIDGHSEQHRLDMINLMEKQRAEGRQLKMEVQP